MCGFVGAVRLMQGGPPDLAEQLNPLADTLVHRGPDDEGLFSDAHCVLAHRRLNVLDLTQAGRQPMSAAGNRWHLAYNGEIYDFQSLRKTHGLGPARSGSDSEVLVELIAQRGIDKAIENIDGMFAFAAWDSQEKRLHLARDPFGVKPLFTRIHDGVFWFASEIKALLDIPGAPRRPSMEALHHYLSFDYIPGPWTAFEGIEQVRPGTHLTVSTSSGSIHVERFSTPQFDPDSSLEFEDCVAQANDLLEQAVRRQMVADVDVGVMLSGGIDSSALAMLMAQIRGDGDFDTFSLGFDEASFDESPYARMVAEAMGTRHHEIRVTPKAVRNALPAVISAIDEPYADGSAAPTFLLSQYARDHVTVLLSGEGGDEFFSGYDTHAAHTARTWYRTLPEWLRRGLIAPLTRMLPVSHKKLSLDFKAKRFVTGAELSPASAHHAWRVVLTEDAKRAVLANPGQFERFSPSVSLFKKAWNECEAADVLNRLLAIDRTHHLPDDLMVKNDRMTMAHSLEARVPFCDSALVDFLASVPVEHKMKGLHPKRLLREMMRDRLPPAVVKKKKVGLELPYSQWLQGPFRELAFDLLSEQRLVEAGIFNSDGVGRLLAEHDAGVHDHGRAIWGLLNYALWYRLYITTEDHRMHRAPVRASILSG